MIKDIFSTEEEYRVLPSSGSILQKSKLLSWQKNQWEAAIPFELPEGVTIEEVQKKLHEIYKSYTELYSLFVSNVFVKDPLRILKIEPKNGEG